MFDQYLGCSIMNGGGCSVKYMSSCHLICKLELQSCYLFPMNFYVFFLLVRWILSCAYAKVPYLGEQVCSLFHPQSISSILVTLFIKKEVIFKTLLARRGWMLLKLSCWRIAHCKEVHEFWTYYHFISILYNLSTYKVL